MKATPQQIAEWQLKYGKGNIRELQADGNFCYVSDPSLNLNKMKMIIAARRKDTGAMVEAILNNCWIGGDDSFKTDAKLKLGLEDQVEDLMELPDGETEDLENGNVIISVNQISIEVRKVTRMDIRYAEDRDRDNKPLAQLQFLLERVAVDEQQLSVLRGHVREYLSVLFTLRSLKDKKHVEVKKY
jgi:hypothetical protein